MREHSPLDHVDALPDIRYLLVHGEKDQSVQKAVHSDRMVKAMRERHLRVEYVERPELAHGRPLDYELNRRIVDFVISNLKRSH